MRRSPGWSLGTQLAFAALLVVALAGALAFLILRLFVPVEEDEVLVVAVATGMLVGLTVALIATASVARPLEALLQAARYIQANDLERQVRIRGPREMRELGEAMEEMRHAIRQSREDLVLTNRGLMEQIDASASDLSEATEGLSVMNAVGAQLAGEPPGGLGGAVEELTRVHWIDGAFVCFATEEGRLAVVAEHHVPRALAQELINDLADGFDRAALLDQGVVVQETHARGDVRWLGARGVGGFAAYPMTTPEGVAGVLVVVAGRRMEITPPREALLRAVAREMGSTLERSELADEAEESRRLAEAVLREMSDGVVVLDGAGRCRVCNPSAARLLAIDRADLVGYLAETALPLPPTVLRTLRGRAEDPGTAASPILAEVAGRQLALLAGPLHDPDPSRMGMIILIRDLTAEAEAERLKQDFVSMVGHELRTPLTMIRTSVDLLREEHAGPLTTEQQRVSRVLASNTDRLLALISDLLDMSALDTGRVQVSPSLIDVTAVAAEIVENNRAAASSKEIELRLDPPGGDIAAWADRARLEQVLGNLVSNGIKYTPEGGHVTIRLGCVDGIDDVRIDVVDDGMGILPAEQEMLFEKFYRTRSGQRVTGGTGLGLAIARSIVELHGGRIWCESDGYTGSTFSFTLPGRPPADAVE